MSKVAIVTDSNSGITQQQAQELGISVLPMPFMIEGKRPQAEMRRTAGEISQTGYRYETARRPI